MHKEKASGYISQLQFNNEETIDISSNDIVVFVGPNNAGKSQSLKDIFTLSKSKMPTVVISDITITKTAGSLISILEEVSQPTPQGSYTSYNYLGKNIGIWSYSENQFPSKAYYGDYRELFVANLTTDARLNICKAPSSIQRTSSKQHPIHYVAFESKYRKWISENFRKAFGTDLIPNTQFGATIPLCMGESVKLTDDFDDEQLRQEAYAEILENYKQVQNQGDGIKSFTGILLYLMLDCYKTFLIDEPESFLHPPQAKIMGQIIGNTLSDNQQAFISTHSEEIIKGLLDICPERVKIIRITRNDDINTFSVLDNEKFNDVWSDPLLKYSNIMSSLFHKSVVLCESDADCKLYSIIENYLKQADGKYSETLFIHCGGKHRMSKIVTALRSLDINVKLITDIDVINDMVVFKGIVESFGLQWSSLQTHYNNIVGNLHSPKEKIKREEARTVINSILDSSKSSDISNKDLAEIETAIKPISKWTPIKKGGVSALPAGDATASYKHIDKILKDAGIHIVPVGELEGFIKEVGGHGPEWVNMVLEKYPDLSDDVYNQIKDFIFSI